MHRRGPKTSAHHRRFASIGQAASLADGPLLWPAPAPDRCLRARPRRAAETASAHCMGTCAPSKSRTPAWRSSASRPRLVDCASMRELVFASDELGACMAIGIGNRHAATRVRSGRPQPNATRGGPRSRNAVLRAPSAGDRSPWPVASAAVLGAAEPAPEDRSNDPPWAPDGPERGIAGFARLRSGVRPRDGPGTVGDPAPKLARRRSRRGCPGRLLRRAWGRRAA